VFDALASSPFNLHVSDLDCTHWGPDALIFMNQIMLAHQEQLVLAATV
jgi:hypothetical protein